MSTRSPEELALSYELGALDRLHARERDALEDEHGLCTSFTSPGADDPLGVLGDVLARLHATQPGERVWASAGWHRLIAELDERLAAIIPSYQLVQVKEKFGGLRYYVHFPGETPEDVVELARGLIRGAEGASLWICEVCGRAGRTRGHGRGRIRTLCTTHRHWGVHEGDEA